MRVLVIGARGRMGSQTVRAVEGAPDLELAAGIDVGDDLTAAIQSHQPRVAVDFTTPDSVAGNLRCLLEHGVHPVVGTTGLAADELREITAECARRGLGGVLAPNFAIGAVLMIELARQAARYLSDIEIIEYHHPAKLDAPSGTALRTHERLQEVLPADTSVPIHSVRLPGYLAHQEVILGQIGERLSIRHDTNDRQCFMPGVLLAVRRAPELDGLVVGLENLLEFDGP